MKRTVRYLSGITEMARFDSLMKATFNPPRNWTLLEDLKFYSDKLDIVSATMLRDCDVQVRNSTKTSQYIITVPKGYITDMASVPRGCWAFIAPFDVARAAVVHDILYENDTKELSTTTISIVKHGDLQYFASKNRKFTFNFSSNRSVYGIWRRQKLFNRISCS